MFCHDIASGTGRVSMSMTLPTLFPSGSRASAGVAICTICMQFAMGNSIRICKGFACVSRAPRPMQSCSADRLGAGSISSRSI